MHNCAFTLQPSTHLQKLSVCSRLRVSPQDRASVWPYEEQPLLVAGGVGIVAADSAYAKPSGPPAWKTIPSWAVIGTGDQVIPPAELTFMAKRAGAHITDVNAGHLSLVSEPSVVIGVILQAVQATG